MQQNQGTPAITPQPDRWNRLRGLRGVGILAPALLAACSGSSSVDSQTSQIPETLDSTRTLGTSASTILIDPHQGGQASSVLVTRQVWGRLVDVYALDATNGDRVLVNPDFVIDPDLASDGTDYELEQDPITGQSRLIILHPEGTPGFKSALRRSEQGLVDLLDRDPLGPPPFSMLPRNAAVVVQFDDAMDVATISPSTARMMVGAPSVVPFEARVLADENHGALLDLDLNGDPEFYPTRLIVDLTTSALEAIESTPPLPINTVGLPASQGENEASTLLRLPTQTSAAHGQLQVLRNLAGNTLALAQNGTVDLTSPTLDVIRAARAGTGSDDNKGFLADGIAPEIIGVQPIQVSAVQAASPVGTYRLNLAFGTPECRFMPHTGDIIELTGVMLQVLNSSSRPDMTVGGGELNGLHVQLIAGPPAQVTPGGGQYSQIFEGSLDQLPACFVRFTPTPAQPPQALVSPFATMRVKFTEPMLGTSIRASETWILRDNSITDPTQNSVFGSIIQSLDLTEATFVPTVPLRHTNGLADVYGFDLLGGPEGPTDLAGNPLLTKLPQFDFILDPSAATTDTGNFVFQFTSADENMDGGRDFRGNFLYAFQEDRVVPRPVVRFSAIADTHQPIVGAMVPFSGSGVAEPMNPFGSKTHMALRNDDLGMTLLDESTYDIDVEGLNWAPFAGQVLVNQFSEFQMSMSHSAKLPDEHLNPATLLPSSPLSGLETTFDNNTLEPATVVHDKTQGYRISPIDLFVSATGRPMMPWPMNQGVAPGQETFWTWRDTSIADVAGDQGSGAPVRRLEQVSGGGSIPIEYASGDVPTVGLPMLTEFRCYPDSGAHGLNGLAVALAINSSARPAFRAFSAGGINSSGSSVLVDPDNAPVATGGFSTTSIPPGQQTLPSDNAVAYGQADFVVRKSRMISTWLDTGSATGLQSFRGEGVPSTGDLPPGTEILIEYRGATSVTSSAGAQIDARNYDAYGNAADNTTGCNCTITPSFLGGDSSWKFDPLQLTGARWIQVRVTFVSNARSGETPDLETLGLSFIR